MIEAICVPKVGKTKRVTIEDIAEYEDMVILRITSFTAYEFADIHITIDKWNKLLEQVK